MSEPPPLPAADLVIPYATPAQFELEAGVCRDGKNLVIPIGVPVPPRCVKCNEPAEPKYSKGRNYYWHPPAVYLLLIFPGVLIYAIVAMIFRKIAKVEVGLCPVHGKRRRNRILMAWGILLFGIVSLIGGIVLSVDPDYRQMASIGMVMGWLGGFSILFSLLFAVFAVRLLWPKKIDNYFVILRGADPRFLDSLPSTIMRV
jgi:hypothetical protein